MSSSAISTQVAQLKIGNVQNQADTSAVYNGGIWSFKNSTAVTSVTITDAGAVTIGPSSAYSSVIHTKYGAMVSFAGFGNSTTRPSIAGGTQGSYEFRAVGDNTVGDHGYLLVSAGGGTSGGTKSFIALSGFSTVPDMDRNIVFGSAGTERARIDVNGNVGIGVVPPGVDVRAAVKAADGNMHAVDFQNNQSGVYATAVIRNNATAGTRILVAFRQSSTDVGQITHNGTNTTYSTGPSDYRLKDEIKDLSDGLEKIKSLRPVSFKWKKSGESAVGFIAHEIQAVIPECVTGEKDAVDAEGNPVYQSIFPAPAQMIANLVAAIQEQQAQIEALRAEVAALKVQP